MKEIIKNQLEYTLNNSISNLENLGRHYRGKVRDNYYFNNQILMVTSDRVSAFDHVLGTIPFKGQILSDIASFWFNKTQHIVPNHYIKSVDPQVLLVKEAKPLPVEVIVRKYITGSLWRDYTKSKHHVYDLDFRSDLVKNQKFGNPILTPSTKEEYGKHDMPISKKEIINQGLVDQDIYELAEKYALQLFSEGEKWAHKQGLILVDTKYEFGLVDGELIFYMPYYLSVNSYDNDGRLVNYRLPQSYTFEMESPRRWRGPPEKKTPVDFAVRCNPVKRGNVMRAAISGSPT